MHYHLAMQPAVDKFSVQAGLQRRICPLLAIGREAPGFLFSALFENKKMHGGRKEKSDKARACKLACKGEGRKNKGG